MDMISSVFADYRTVFLGALFGLLFGFFLRKAHVTRFNTIVGQLVLRDFTVMKVIFTAIIVGGVGVYFMLGTGMISSLLLSPAALAPVIIGGSIFGVGMAVLGYCPGTCIAALGDGSRDVIFGIFGMFAAVASYAEIYPWLKTKLQLTVDHAQTLTIATGLSPWILFGLLTVFAVGFFTLLRVLQPKAV